MKTFEQLQDRLNSLEDSLTRLNEEIGENYDYQESLDLEVEIYIIEAKISTLKWVMQQ
jgi:predicted  nucleic acid-binding Zn-ribbon protein